MRTFTAFLSGAILSRSAVADDCSVAQQSLSSLLTSTCGQQVVSQYCANPSPGTSTTTTTTSTKNGGGQPSSDTPFIGSYYPNWMVYRKHYMGLAKIGTTDEPISPDAAKAEYVVFPSTLGTLMSKLNTLYYAFLKLDDNCYVTDADTDASWYGKGEGNEPTWIKVPAGACKGAMNDLLSLKDQYPHLKLLISVGGWTFSDQYSQCAAKGEDGFKKIYDSFSFYTNGSFGKADSNWAGIDIDWEYPAAAGASTNFDATNDWPNYVKMLQYFRKRAASESRDKFMITSAFGVGDTLDVFIKDTTTAKAFCDALDHLNMMTYDMWGKWDPTTGHNAPFCQVDNTDKARPAPKTLPWTVVDRVSAVAAICGASKLALGIPNYSPAWTDIPSTDNGLYQTSTNSQNWATWSTFSDSDKSLTPQGIIHYWDLQDALKAESSLKVYSKNCPAAGGVTVPVKWVYSADKKIFASYEDVDVVKAKSQWAKATGLTGFFFWDLSQDKTGELIDAARSGWGISTPYPASGTKTCHDGDRPDFSKNPDGSDNPYDGCHFSKRSLVADQAGQGCSAYQAKAASDCGAKKAIAVGATRSGQTACVNSCDTAWGNGKDGIWAQDTIYYVCDGEDTIDPNGGGNGGGDNGGGDNGGNGGGDGSTCYAHTSWSGDAACVKCASPVQGQCPTSSYTKCYDTADACQANPST